MKILVTGCGGFIGYHLVGKLLTGGHDLVCTDTEKISYVTTPLRHERLSLLKERFEEKFEYYGERLKK